MAQVKVQFALGSLSFSGEGDHKWVEAQIDKIIEKAPTLAALSAPSVRAEQPRAASASSSDRQTTVGTLASFINASHAGSNQVKRFLATAEWLHRRGQHRIGTGEVTKALMENSQKRLGNPADSLNKNVAKGYCEKDGKQFYVTDEGRASLGNSG